MSVVQQDDIQQVWERIKVSAAANPALAGFEDSPVARGRQVRPKKSLADMIGLWADMPPLTDADVKRVLEEEPIRKF